jgi:hypothetical protein
LWFEVRKRVGIWGDDEEKLFAFQKNDYPKFSFVQDAEKNPSELNLYAAKKKPYCDVEAAV